MDNSKGRFDKKFFIFLSSLVSVILMTIFFQSKVVYSNGISTMNDINVKKNEVVSKKAVQEEDVFKKYSIMNNKINNETPVPTIVEFGKKVEENRIKRSRAAYSLMVKKEVTRRERIRHQLIEQRRQERIQQEKIRQQVLEKQRQETLKTQQEKSTMAIQAEPSQRTIYATVTAYTSYCSEGCIGVTATGVDVSQTTKYEGMSIIATDPNVIPLYSIVKVYPNDRPPFTAISMDTGGAINGNKVDYLISVSDNGLARSFGKQNNIRIDIIREGK